MTPNAAVDKTFEVDGFCLDRVHRLAELADGEQSVEHQYLAGGLLGSGLGRLARHEQAGFQLRLAAGQLGVFHMFGQGQNLGRGDLEGVFLELTYGKAAIR